MLVFSVFGVEEKDTFIIKHIAIYNQYYKAYLQLYEKFLKALLELCIQSYLYSP